MTSKPGNDGREPKAADSAASAVLKARVKDLERENVRLRRIVADKDLEIEMLRELSRGTY